MKINTVYNADSKEQLLDLENNSVDLIYTDPVYQNPEDYEWLGHFANRVLKEDKSLLCFCSKRNQHEITRIIENQGLKFIYYFEVVLRAKASRLIYYNIFTWSTPLLWFGKGEPRPEYWVPDVYMTSASNPQGKNKSLHKWNKNIENITYYLLPFSQEDDLVVDPFCGTGPILKACQIHNRNFIGCEIETVTFDDCQKRLEGTTTFNVKVGSSSKESLF